MIGKKPERLVVDLSAVTYIDSAGLAALIQAMQKVAPTLGLDGVVSGVGSGESGVVASE